MTGNPFEDPDTGIAAGDLDQVFARELAALVVVGSDEGFGVDARVCRCLGVYASVDTMIGTLAFFAFTRAETISREPLGVMHSA